MGSPQTQRQLPPGLRAEAMAWPLRWGKDGFERVQGVPRVRSSLEHLTSTPLGSYLVDPAYGVIFYQMRTQGMSLDDQGESGSGLQSVCIAHYKQQAATYLPYVVLHGVTPRVDTQSRLRIHVIWTVASLGGKGGPASVQSGGIGAMAPLAVVV